MANLIKLERNGILYAIIIKDQYSAKGVEFFTPDIFPQQIAYMKHSSGKRIGAHLHNSIERVIFKTQETLIIKSGILEVEIYDNHRQLLFTSRLNKGDIIFLADGGHGFVVIEDVEMIEIKQGPYLGEIEKERFV